MTTVLSGAHVSPSGEPGAISGGLPVGSIVEYGGSVEPAGWYFCYGQAISRTGINANLFSVIGTSFGAGDGSTFNLPDFRGRVGVGLGNMGGTYADRMAYAKTCNTTSGNVNLSTTSSDWLVDGKNVLAVGMFIHGPGIPAGTTIVTLGTVNNIVMSAAATATQSGVTVRFSVLDKLSLGGAGGTQSHSLTEEELASHYHLANKIVGGPGLTSGSNYSALPENVVGEDHAHPNVQPSLFVNVIIKYATPLSGSLIAGTGDVVGPAGAVDGSIALFDGTSGKQIRSTPVATFVPVGGVVQLKYTEITGTSNTVIPNASNPPQITEGLQMGSMLFTPKYANSLLRLRIAGTVSNNAAAWTTIAIFRAPLTGAIAFGKNYANVAGGGNTLTIDKFDAPATISELTYTIRMGTNTGLATIGMNAAYTMPMTFVIEEIKQ